MTQPSPSERDEVPIPRGERRAVDSARTDDDTPGVPGFRTWRGVYWFVLGFFVAVVVMLTLFTRAFA